MERSIKQYTSWAGLHKTEFEDSYAFSTITVSGYSGLNWFVYGAFAVEDTNVEVSYKVSSATAQGATVNYDPVDDVGWVVGVDESNNFQVMRVYSNTVRILLCSIPIDWTLPSGEVDVTVAFKEERADHETFHSASMWINDRLVGSYITKADPIESARNVGFAVKDMSRTFTSYRVPQLTDLVEWSSLDIGEFPLSGMQRALEGRYVKFFVRYDGTFRAWRPTSTSSVLTLSNDYVYDPVVVHDKRGFANHIRMVGAYEWAESFRPDLIQAYGYRFAEANNPYLMNKQACLREAEREIRRLEEQVKRMTLKSPFTPLLELEDHITAWDDEWIVSGRAWKFQPGLVLQELNLRKYTYGS